MKDVKRFEPFWGSWYVTAVLGEGGFGKVYKIERREFGNTYSAALKHIRLPKTLAEVQTLVSLIFAHSRQPGISH